MNPYLYDYQTMTKIPKKKRKNIEKDWTYLLQRQRSIKETKIK